MMSFLRERTREGWQSRYGRAEAEVKRRARRQIERELNLIEHLKLAGYFLIVWDLVRYLPRTENSGPGPRIGRQQRSLLFARHHRRRSHWHGIAL